MGNCPRYKKKRHLLYIYLINTAFCLKNFRGSNKGDYRKYLAVIHGLIHESTSEGLEYI